MDYLLQKQEGVYSQFFTNEDSVYVDSSFVLNPPYKLQANQMYGTGQGGLMSSVLFVRGNEVNPPFIYKKNGNASQLSKNRRAQPSC